MEKKVKETKTKKVAKKDLVKNEKVVVETKNYTKQLNNIFYILIAIAIILGLMLIINVAGIISGTDNTNDTEVTEEEVSGEYDVSMFTEMTTSEALDKISKKGTEVVYIGRPSCGYCVKFLPVLQQAQEEYDYETIYIDLEKMSSDDQTNILSVDNSEGYIKENFGYTPMVLIFKDGKLSQGWVGYSEYDSFAKFLEDNGFSK